LFPIWELYLSGYDVVGRPMDYSGKPAAFRNEVKSECFGRIREEAIHHFGLDINGVPA
jgi:hypothetical protein